MTRQLRDLPRRKIAENLRGPLAHLVLQGTDFRIDVYARATEGGLAEITDFGFQIGNRAFEIQILQGGGPFVKNIPQFSGFTLTMPTRLGRYSVAQGRSKLSRKRLTPGCARRTAGSFASSRIARSPS